MIDETISYIKIKNIKMLDIYQLEELEIQSL